MSKAFDTWAADVEATCRAIKRCDHAWLTANSNYKHCPNCGEHLYNTTTAAKKEAKEVKPGKIGY